MFLVIIAVLATLAVLAQYMGMYLKHRRVMARIRRRLG